MSLWTRLRSLLSGSQGVQPAAGTTLSGRPTYASAIGTLATIPRQESFRLLTQFYGSIPALKRAVGVLAGFVGTPEFLCPTEAATTDMNRWATEVEFGHIGMGLGSLLRDHVRQSLIYGFGVGEVELTPDLKSIQRLWSYRSPSFGFRAGEFGQIEILQQTNARGIITLNPETAFLTTHDTSGTDPNGESLFLAIPSVAQCWLDVLHNYRETWRRTGTPKFHVNWEPPVGFSDPQGVVGEKVVGFLKTNWVAMMKDQVVNGRANDYFSTGKISVTTIGADGQVLDFTVGHRNLLEEIVVATNIPAWLLGYGWSTTERLSTQQADMLLAFIDILRDEVSSSVLHIGQMRQRLAGQRGGFVVQWPEINLQDLIERARAELFQAQAQHAKQVVARQLWTDGVYDQEDYAEAMTGIPEVKTPYDLPPAAVMLPLASGTGDNTN